MVEALISEQRASDEGELPKELVQDVESEPASFQEACSSKHALIWDKAMSAEFEGLLGAGTFPLAAKTPECWIKSVMRRIMCSQQPSLRARASLQHTV